MLFSVSTAGLVVSRVEIAEISRNKVTAKLLCGPTPEDFQPDIEIKGVTYHGLTVQTHEWDIRQEVVFDI